MRRLQDCKNVFFNQLQRAFDQFIQNNDLRKIEVQVKATPLTPEEAIGATQRQDYVLLKGKERLLQAEVMGYRGQAFTSSLGDFAGSLADVLKLPLDNDFFRAIYVATLNAVACSAGKVSNTVHCRNEGPGKCCQQVVQYFRQNFTCPRIVMLGYQPALAEALVKEFPVYVLDLDPTNIGKTINGVEIFDGCKDAAQCLNQADVIFATGSILCNGSIDNYYNTGKPLVLYGTTGAGAAAFMNIPRFCPESLNGRKDFYHRE